MTSPHTPSVSRSRSRPAGSLAPGAKVFSSGASSGPAAFASTGRRRTTVSSTRRHATPSRGSTRGPCARRCPGSPLVHRSSGSITCESAEMRRRPTASARTATPHALSTWEGDPRLPCTGAGAPSPLRFGAAGHGSGSDRPVRRLIGAPTAPPLPCCAVTDRGFPARAARGLGRRSTQRPQPAQVQGGAGEVPLFAHLRQAAEDEATKAHRLLALRVPTKDVPYARGPNSAAGRRGRRRSAYEAPRAAADRGARPGGAESKRRRRPRLPAPPSRVTLLARSPSRSLGPPVPWRRMPAVGEVYADFERELHRLGGKYAAHPRRETIRLLLLALEREQLVATGYREDVIAECLTAMPIGDAARDVIRHALLWVWKDEEMHTIYVRGALLKLGSLRLRVSSTIQQLAGWIGGWASSVQHHVRWRDAPLSRLFATLFTAAGALVGKVPRPVARELRFGSFGSFCRFNVDAERTAALCWKRLCDLAAEHQNPHTPLAELERIRDDEERHERLFALFAAALDEHDRLRPGVTAATLAAEVAAVGEPFLPRALRTRGAAENPLGSGGPVWVMCGERAEDKLSIFH